MTTAQARLAALAEWVKASSANEKAPLGKDTIVRGAFAVFLPRPLNAPPDPFAVGPEHLPLWIPEQQSIADLPPLPTDPTTSQPRVADRLRHLVWMFDGRFHGALIPLSDPAEALQTALDRHLPGLDLDHHPALFLPVWQLVGEDWAWADARLPLVR
ncbi:hypothetical protein [Anaeromyxobacter sp. SG17]|uniref:hypothetical protein n=1 Tax=Anaeromyxobacter sp. SG17 TaxID=2925405 RepID=UPI001F5842DF|nr:hypothetical protein [Anaeromyxobacter sp. SG17]